MDMLRKDVKTSKLPGSFRDAQARYWSCRRRGDQAHAVAASSSPRRMSGSVIRGAADAWVPKVVAGYSACDDS